MNEHPDRDSDYNEDYGSSSARDERDDRSRGRPDDDRYRASGSQANRGSFDRGREGGRPNQYSGPGGGSREFRQGSHNPGGYGRSEYGRSEYQQASSQQRNYGTGGYGGAGRSQGRYPGGGSEEFGYPQRGYGPAGYGGSEYGEAYDGQGFGRASQGYPEGRSQAWGGSNAARSGDYSSEWSRGFGQSESGSGVRGSFGGMAGSGAERWGEQSTRRQGGFYGKGPKGYTRSDDRIREDVCDRLSDDDELDASDITVTVSGGEVTLEGTVPDRRSKHRAEDIADAVTGVQDVHNSLRARKGLLQEMGDRLTGRDDVEHGHSGSGTRNSPAGTQATATGTGRI